MKKPFGPEQREPFIKFFCPHCLADAAANPAAICPCCGRNICWECARKYGHLLFEIEKAQAATAVASEALSRARQALVTAGATA